MAHQWKILYNGFGHQTADPPPTSESENDWDVLKIDGHRSVAVFADDGISHQTTRHEMRGVALISDPNAEAFEGKLVRARALLCRVGRRLIITTGTDNQAITFANVGPGSPDSPYDAGDPGGDEYQETPRCDFNINRIFGTKTAVVGFTFTWTDFDILVATDPATADIYHVMSHTWTQRFTSDEAGNPTHVVNGVLRTRNDKGDDDNISNANARCGPNPDQYRHVVLPILPAPGYRQTAAEFFTDESGQQLIYQVTNKSYPRELPGPAMKGNARFTWRRSPLESGKSFLGMKIFEGELEGDQTVNPARLLTHLVLMASSRITWSNAPGLDPPDLIQEIAVVESDLVNTNRVALRIVAQSLGVIGSVDGAPDAAPANPLNMTGPGYSILDDILAKIKATPAGAAGDYDYARPQVYTDSHITSQRRLAFNPLPVYTWDQDYGGDFPQAKTESPKLLVAEQPISGYVKPATLLNGLLADTMPEQEGQHVPDIKDRDDDASFGLAPHAHIDMTERVVTPDTGMLVLRSQSLVGNDVPFQRWKPQTFIYTKYVMSRAGRAPTRVMLKVPAGCIVRGENWNVNTGFIDANNNRVFHGVYERVVEVMDRDQVGGPITEQPIWTQDQVAYNAQDYDFRRFTPGAGTTSGFIRMPFDPQTEAPATAIERTAFDLHPADTANETGQFHFVFAADIAYATPDPAAP